MHISVIRTFGNNFLNKWESIDEAYQNTVNTWDHCLLNHLLNVRRGVGFDSLKAFFVDKKPLKLLNKHETDLDGVEFSAVRQTQCMLGMWKIGYSSCLFVCLSVTQREGNVDCLTRDNSFRGRERGWFSHTVFLSCVDYNGRKKVG